jgi:hypothetical protein
MLPREYEEYIANLSNAGEKRLKDTREKRLSPIFERVGMRSPQVAELESKTQAGLDEKLTGVRAKMGVERLKREESLTDVEESRKYATREKSRDINLKREVIQKQLEEAARSREFSAEQAKIERDWKESLMKEEMKRKKNAGIASFLTNIVTGGAMGLAFPSTLGLGGEAGEGFGGFLKKMFGGAAAGGENVGELSGIQRYLDFISAKEEE